MAKLATSPGVVDTTIHQFDLTENCVASSKTYTLDRKVVFNSITAGSIAGMLSCALFHPFDVLRTKMQASIVLPKYSTATTYPISIPRDSGTALDILRQTIRSGGLYTGLSLPLAAQALYKATIFTTNQVTRSVLIELKTQEKIKRGICTPYQLSLLDYFVCGATSGAINALLFVSPVEFVRNNLIMQHTRTTEATMAAINGPPKQFNYKRRPIDVVRNTYNTHGITGLWRGSFLTVARDSLGCGAFFFMYEVGQEYIPLITGKSRGDLMNAIVSGFLAGFGFWAVALPFDTLRTVVQSNAVESVHEALAQLKQRYGSIGTIKQLYRGWQFGLGRGSPSAALTLTVYTSVYDYCAKVI